MSYSVCLDCRIALTIKKSDVLMKWDQVDIETDYTRYGRASLLQCDYCGYRLIQFGSIVDKDLIFHKDLEPYRQSPNWMVIDSRWKYS